MSESGEKFYYEKWMEETRKSKKLALELEEYKKRYEYNKNFHKEHFRYKKVFEPLEAAYNKLREYFELLHPMFVSIIQLYKNKLLLNPDFPEVRLSETDKDFLISETRKILIKYQKRITIPKIVSSKKLKKDFNSYNDSKNDAIIIVKKQKE